MPRQKQKCLSTSFLPTAYRVLLPEKRTAQDKAQDSKMNSVHTRTGTQRMKKPGWGKEFINTPSSWQLRKKVYAGW